MKETENPTNSVTQENWIVAGLRILLLVASSFILWSFLALISSLYHPFASLVTLFASQTAPKTLADSLFSEIFSAYFSFFTLISLGLLVSSAYFGYRWAKNKSSLFFTYSNQPKPIRFLFSRILHINNHPMIRIQKEDIRKFNKNRDSIHGPAVIQLDDPMSVMATKTMREFRILQSTSEKQILVAPHERVIKFIDPGIKIFETKFMDSALSDSAVSMHLEYRLRIPPLEEQRNNPYWISNFNEDSQKTLDLIESMIHSELSVFMKSKSILQAGFGQGTDKMINPNEIKRIHKKNIHLIHWGFTKKQNQGFFRNRKRLLVHMGSSIVSNQDIGSQRKETDAKFGQWMNEFENKLKISLFQLFGYNPIEMFNYKLGDF